VGIIAERMWLACAGAGKINRTNIITILSREYEAA